MKIKRKWLVVTTLAAMCGLLLIGATSAMAEENKDTMSPLVTVDFEGYSYHDLPIGQTGIAYPIFKASALDIRDGETPVEVKVFKKGTNRNLYDLGTNTFTPTSAGIYTLSYESTDTSGNTSKAQYTVVVEDSVAAPEIIGEFANEYMLYTGEKFALIDAEVKGGSGECVLKASVALSTGEVYTFDSFIDNLFVPEKAGVYTVTYSAVDYLKRSDAVSYMINVSNNDKPIIDDVYFPAQETAGTAFSFDKFIAYDYSGDGVKKETTKSIKITYGNQEYTLSAGETFTPQPIGQKGSITEMVIVLRATGQNGVATQTHKVNIVNTKLGNKYYLPAYMIGGENVSVDNSGTMKYKTSVAGEAIRSVKSFVADGFSFGFKTKNITKATLVLTDSMRDDLQVSIALQSTGSGTNMILNGIEVAVPANVQFGESMLMSFNVAKSAIEFNADGGSTLKSFATVDTYANGKAFKGFPSGKVYFSFVFDAILGEEASVSIENFGNVNVSLVSDINDLTAPQLVVNDFEKTRVNLGDVVKVPTAVASDAISDLKYFKLEIVSPDGSYLLQDGDPMLGYTFTAEQYGVYLVRYLVEDLHYNKPTISAFAVTVVDRIAPEIAISGNIPTNGEIGREILFPSFEVSDNLSEEDFLNAYIVVITPRYEYHVVLEEEGVWKYKPVVAGVHTVVYYVEDEDGNVSMKEFDLLIE